MFKLKQNFYVEFQEHFKKLNIVSLVYMLDISLTKSFDAGQVKDMWGTA